MARRHPVALFLVFLLLSPYLLAAVALAVALTAACYLIGGVVYVASGRRII